MEEVISAVAYMNIDQCKALMEKRTEMALGCKINYISSMFVLHEWRKKDFTYWKQCSWIIQSASEV